MTAPIDVDLAEFFKPPSWTSGRISFEDAEFLTDCIGAGLSKPMIEVGVASGWSSAVLLHLLQRQPPRTADGIWLHSYDVAEWCYFDLNRRVGAAVTEVVPTLAPHWRLQVGHAMDAGKQLEGLGSELAFIDAYHRHPWATLDLLALLPALAPKAWVVLHDIRLPEISKWQEFGPMHLFRGWPGPRREEKKVGNIGAIQLFASANDTRAACLQLLSGEWEVPVDPGYLHALGIPHLQTTRCAKPPELTPELVACLMETGREGRPIAVWGAGSAGRRFVAAARQSGVSPEWLIDSDPAKAGMEIEGTPVRGPESLAASSKRPYVLVASQFAAQIEVRLTELQFSRNEDYLVLDVIGGSGPIGVEDVPAHNNAADQQLLGMTTLEEQRFLHDYARRRYAGAGAIVDLGCWLGSTTIPLARGLAENPARSGHVVHAYDRFIWENWMVPFAGELAGRFREGDSFLPLFRERIAAVADRVDIHATDLKRETWGGGPIEFLLVDAAKDWELCTQINRTFVVALVPERGVLMHQDFKFWGCPWIHLSMYRLREWFEIERDLTESAGTVFRMRGTPDRTRIEEKVAPGSFDSAEIDEAYEYWLAQLKGPLAYLLRLARIIALLEIGEDAKARGALTAAMDLGIVFPRPFNDVIARRMPAFQIPRRERSWQGECQRAIDEGRPIVLWGAGSAGRSALERLKGSRKHVQAFVDRDLRKQGSTISGVPVHSIAWLQQARASSRLFVLITTSFAPEVVAELQRMEWMNTDYAVVDVL